MYGIYRATSAEGKYTLIATTKSSSYNNTKLKTNSTYYYKVRAYNINGKIVSFSGLTPVVSVKPILAAPISVKAASASYNSINVSWSRVAGSSLYGIYRATSSAGKYTLVSSTKASYNSMKIASNNLYYYKVRSYRIIGNVKIFSDLSSVVHAR